MAALLEIRDYRLDIKTFDGRLHVLDGIDLEVERGDTLGIVGESGCGKTVLVRSVMGLGPKTGERLSGTMRFDGQAVDGLSEAEWRKLRGVRISMIFQDPMTYLNPLFTVGRQIGDVVAAHARASDRPVPRRSERRARAVELLGQVRIPDPERSFDQYPHQLSGGMRQRVLIAMALAGKPELLIADEPTTALDVTIQKQILELINDLVARLKLTVVMISHDVGAIAAVARRAAVMYAGTVVEQGETTSLLARPLHPYTKGLLAAVPEISGDKRSLQAIPGSIPDLLDPPSGCRFHPRCSLAEGLCADREPPLAPIMPLHRVACLARQPGSGHTAAPAEVLAA